MAISCSTGSNPYFWRDASARPYRSDAGSAAAVRWKLAIWPDGVPRKVTTMSDVITEYQKWKRQGDDLRIQAK
jgi:hypothetical protein